MAIYLGTQKKRKLRLGSFLIRIPSTSLFEGIVLMSIDNLKLKEANNLQITAKENKE